MTDTNTIHNLLEESIHIADEAANISEQAITLSESLANLQHEVNPTIIQGVDPFIFGFTVFILACFIGYYVIWKVTPALHTPLMAVTNAISSIIIVGALIASTAQTNNLSNWLSYVAIFLTAINIFGGFVVTQRMLQMFKKKD